MISINQDLDQDEFKTVPTPPTKKVIKAAKIHVKLFEDHKKMEAKKKLLLQKWNQKYYTNVGKEKLVEGKKKSK